MLVGLFFEAQRRRGRRARGGVSKGRIFLTTLSALLEAAEATSTSEGQTS
jgi:hypothetical protein